MFFDKRLVFRTWQCLVMRFQQCSWADEQYRSMLLLRSFSCWLSSAVHSRRLNELHSRQALVFHHRTVLRIAFNKWQRRLWSRKAFLFHFTSLKRRSFSRWKQALSQSVAIDQLGCALAQQYRNRFLLKRSLLAWKTAAHEHRHHRVVVAVFRAHQQSAVLSNCFLSWRDALLIRQQHNVARRMWTEHCVRRAVLCWRNVVYTSRLQQLAQVISSGRERQLLRSVFRQWCWHFSLRKAVVRFRANSAAMQARLVFRLWAKRSRQEKNAKELCEKHRFAVAGRCFQSWYSLSVSSHCRTKQLHDFKLKKMQKAWQKWRKCLHIRHSEEFAAHVYRRNLLARAWTQWQACLNLQHTNTVVSRLSSLHAQRICFRLWKANLQASKKMKALREKAKREDSTRLHDTFTHWLSITRSLRRHQQRLNEVAVLHRRLLSLHRCVVVWRRSLLTVSLAKKMAHVKHQKFLRQIIVAWRDVLAVNEEDEIALFEACLEERDSHKTHQLLLTDFLPSRQLAARAIARWQQPLRYRAWLSWRCFCKVQKLHRRQSAAGAAFCEIRLKKDVLKEWRRQVHLRMTVRQFFSKWKQVSAMNSAIRVHHDITLVRRCVSQWRMFVARQRENQQIASVFAQRTDDVMVRSFFMCWCAHLSRLSQRQLVLAELEEEWHQRRLTHFFQRWLHRWKLLRVHVALERKMLKKCFWRWRLSLAATSPHLFSPEFQLRVDHLEKVRIWRIWRRQFVTKQAMNEFEASENTELCRQVFRAWHKFAQVKKKSSNHRKRQLMKKAFLVWRERSQRKHLL